MNIYLLDMNTKLAALDYKEVKSNLVRVHVEVTLYVLNNRLDQIKYSLNLIDTRRLDSFEYCCSSIDDSYRSIQFNYINHHLNFF